VAKKSKTGNAAHGKHTLKTQSVKDFLEFLCLSENLLLGLTESIKKYNKSKTDRERRNLYRMTEIDGFIDEYNTSRARYMINRAWDGLTVNTGKQKLIEQKLDKDGGVHDCEKEIPPDTNACTAVLKLLVKNPLGSQENIASFFRQAADLIDGEK
jgi:hypothetical protein